MQNLGESETWRRRSTLMLLGVALVGWHLSFEGIRALKPFWTSVELATIITVFHAFSWSLIYAAVPQVVAGRVPPGRRRIPVVIGIVAAAGIVTTATFFSWVSVAAAPSARKACLEIIDASTTALAELRDARQRERELRPVLAQTSESILQLAQDEEGHGALSTKGRKGPFTYALYSLASAYADAAEILENDDATAQENFAEAERILATMRVLHADASTHDDRVEDINTRFAQAAFRLHGILSDLKKSPLRSVLTVVRKSDASIAFIPARRDSPQETAAKAALIKLSGDSKARIDHLAEGVDRSFIKIPRYETLSREEVAITYIAAFPQYPIICITIDLVLPLIGLLASIFFSPFQVSDPAATARGERAPTPTAPNPTNIARAPSTKGENYEQIIQALRRSSAEKAARSRGDSQKVGRRTAP
ncbi:hypothetical protein WME77_19350 [Sorangium sp. So ce764]|uniref:hypothetical protein n=1 Tax=Sorangium sp. So ce764 TaxID=3133320 RepID=UPI003F5F6007